MFQKTNRRALLQGGLALVTFTTGAAAKSVTDASGARISASGPKRILTIGSDVTEIVFALGRGGDVVAIDSTSAFPPEAAKLPNVGYMRALSAEGVLSVSPDLILASAGSGPPPVIAALKQSGVPIALVEDTPAAESVSRKIALIADLLDKADEGKALSAAVEAGLAALLAKRAGLKTHPRAVFILSLAGGRIMAGGEQTSAAAMLDLAGAENAASGFTGYKPISDEAMIAAAPDAIIMMTSRNEGTTAATLFAREPFASLPAARTQRLIKMDGSYLLAFGPRLPEAARDLMKALHSGAAI